MDLEEHFDDLFMDEVEKIMVERIGKDLDAQLTVDDVDQLQRYVEAMEEEVARRFRHAFVAEIERLQKEAGPGSLKELVRLFPQIHQVSSYVDFDDKIARGVGLYVEKEALPRLRYRLAEIRGAVTGS